MNIKAIKIANISNPDGIIKINKKATDISPSICKLNTPSCTPFNNKNPQIISITKMQTKGNII
jgi:hypothetical protein